MSASCMLYCLKGARLGLHSCSAEIGSRLLLTSYLMHKTDHILRSKTIIPQLDTIEEAYCFSQLCCPWHRARQGSLDPIRLNFSNIQHRPRWKRLHGSKYRVPRPMHLSSADRLPAFKQHSFATYCGSMNDSYAEGC